ncbi:hypothetical protein HK104_003178, partial [Borealophlyctis nickersoniae]
MSSKAGTPSNVPGTRTTTNYDKLSEDIDQLIASSSTKSSTVASFGRDLAARRDAERQERERKERERAEMAERERAKREKQEKERLEMERLEQQRMEATRAEREKADKERLERIERQERERAEREKSERERLELEKLERERAEAAERERRAGDRAAKEKEAEQRELERREQEKQRRDAERMEQERREADRREAEMVAAERERMMAADRERKAQRSATAEDADAPVDENVSVDLAAVERTLIIVTPDYIQGLMMTLQADTTPTPTPEDFTSPEGFAMWQQTMGMSLQEVLSELLKARYIDGPERLRREAEINRRKKEEPKEPAGPSTAIKIFFKVVSAQGLLSKEGRTRDAYCTIAYGADPDPDDDKRRNQQVFNTEVVKGTNNPTWNQHLNITATNLTDKVVVAVYDKAKDHFLGRVKLGFQEMITASAKEGYVGRWYPLEGRGNSKDKYVGGEVSVEFSLNQKENEASGPSTVQAPSNADPAALLQSQLVNCRVNFKSLYKTLLRSCLVMDNNVLAAQFAPHPIPDSTLEILSAESKSLLTVLGRLWAVGDAFRVIAYLGLLFEKYKGYEIPTSSLLNAYETLYNNMRKKQGWLSSYEEPALIDLLDQMQSYYRTQVTKYKEFYPKNMPRGALETTILMLRMIHKNPIYRDAHPGIPESFRDELKSVMNEAAMARYQKLSELTSPFDETDVEAVVEGVEKLAEMLSEEIEQDHKYFMKPFSRELDIVRLTAETYLKHLVLTLEDNASVIASDEAVRSASKTVFALYKRLRVMDERYARMVPGLKRLSLNAGFNVERWFAPFVHKWLEHLGERTLEWVTNAVKADNFEPIVPPGTGGGNDGLHHSSSIADLFSAVYQELDFIADLGWSNVVQNALFLQAFAKTVNKAIEQYCDAIALGELKVDAGKEMGWRDLLVNKTANGPRDIGNESCVKLCNIEYAMSKLDDMYRMMNVKALTQTIKNHRATLMPPRRGANASGGSDDSNSVSGAFKIQILYGENLKPCNKNGLASPYVVVRVPEGTVLPPDEDMQAGGAGAAAMARSSTGTTGSSSASTLGRPRSSSSSGSSGAAPAPTVLNGSACEMARTRTISDSINPTWDETFQVMLPPVSRLEVAVLSRNLLTADEVAGKNSINLQSLKKKLADHQTHDVFVEMDPQGRILLRLTLEGKDEDVDFWFRRSKERLVRLRNDFVRALTTRINPYVREVITKAIKDHEAAPVPSKSFFSSLTTTAQLSDKTASGASIEERVSASDADAALAPLTDYLNKNLATLCEILSTRMAQELIRRIWDETLSIVEGTLVPPLYGPVERDRRVLNRRQVSMADWTVRIMRDFFHADGEDLGLPIRHLETQKYVWVTSLVEAYLVSDLARLKREYELGLLAGRDKEYLLRLVRLRYEKGEEAEREEGRKWVESQLVKRKEVSRIVLMLSCW